MKQLEKCNRSQVISTLSEVTSINCFILRGLLCDNTVLSNYTCSALAGRQSSYMRKQSVVISISAQPTETSFLAALKHNIVSSQ